MKTYIGSSTNEQIRFKATSGGVGSSIVKYLLDKKIVDYALSFEYDSASLSYIPCLIKSFSDYKICGSIYQEIDLIRQLKLMLSNKSGGGKIVFFSLPCQTRALKKICIDAGYEPLTIGLTCSSQQSHEATSYLLSRLKIRENEVEKIQYRGNGWPSGIQIKKKDGNEIFIKNNGSIWTRIFHSRLFIQPRCFSCTNTLNDYADIVLADPWLKKYTDEEKIGKTLFATYTKVGESCVNGSIKAGYITAELIDNETLYYSQRTTIKRKKAYKAHPKMRCRMSKLFLSRKYIKLAKLPFFFGIHCHIKNWIEYFMTKKKSSSL